MIRLMALAFTLTVATSAQAMPLPKLDVPDGLVTQVAQACGAGYRRVSGVCVRRATADRPAALSAELPGDAQDGAHAPASDIIDTIDPLLLASTTGEQI